MTDDKMTAAHADVLAIKARIARLLGDTGNTEEDLSSPGLAQKTMALLRRVRRRLQVP